MRTLAVLVILSLATNMAVAEPAQRSALAAATALRGPLEGRWRLATPQGRALYAFELVDPGGGPDPRAASIQAPGVEGAWRDLDRPGDKRASGVFDSVTGRGQVLRLRFSEGQPPRRLSLALRRGPRGVWRGQLRSEAATTRVVMER